MPKQQRPVRVGRRTVEVSNPGKVLYPGDGITKGDLVDYDLRVAGRMLPHLRGRPVAMERYPDGIDGERIFQKDVPGYFPGWVDRAKVHKEGGTTSSSSTWTRPVQLPSFPKTTGGKGVHVTVPLDRRADFDAVRRFAREVAAVLAGRRRGRSLSRARRRLDALAGDGG